MSLPSAFLDEIRDRTRLSALIQRDVKLQRAGAEMKGCCPFHQEKTASFYVNDAKGFYHCFGCSAHGDAIRWMTDHKGLSFMDAVRELAEQAGLEMPARDAGANEADARRARLFDIMARAERFYAGQLGAPASEARAARELLAARGVALAQIAAFGIGFAPPAPRGAPSPIQTALRDVDPAVLVELGLLKRSDDGRLYDFFRNRIMIPIHDARGRTIGFGARAIGDAEPKYLNSPDTPLFDKGRTLFNLHRAAGAARRKGRLIIVEGYLDVLALARAGIEEAVAPNGTAITETQLEAMWRLDGAPILCLDGDKPGRKAATRIARLALPHLAPGKALRFAFPPAGQDPDDLQRASGAGAVSALFDDTRTIPSVLWQAALEQFDGGRNADSRAALVAHIEKLVKEIRSEHVALTYWGEWRQLLKGSAQRAARGALKPARGTPLSAQVEASVIAGLIRHPQVLAAEAVQLVEVHWSDADARAVAGALVDASIASPGEDPLPALERANLAGIARALVARSKLAFTFIRRGPDNKTAAELVDVINGMPRL